MCQAVNKMFDILLFITMLVDEIGVFDQYLMLSVINNRLVNETVEYEGTKGSFRKNKRKHLHFHPLENL